MSNSPAPSKLTQNELRELREEILNTTSREEKKEAKIIFDGKQYSIRFPKKFIEEAEINLEKDFFEIYLKIPEFMSNEKPSLSVKLIRLDKKQ
jgi:hypothetical protein